MNENALADDLSEAEPSWEFRELAASCLDIHMMKIQTAR
jgi:hypothetical protein